MFDKSIVQHVNTMTCTEGRLIDVNCDSRQDTRERVDTRAVLVFFLLRYKNEETELVPSQHLCPITRRGVAVAMSLSFITARV